MSRPCALYRHFDKYGILLYVGISDHPGARAKGHRSTDWAGYASYGTVKWYPTRELAFAAETEAIRREKPIFNKMHAWGYKAGMKIYVENYASKELSNHQESSQPTKVEPRKDSESDVMSLKQASRYLNSTLGALKNHRARSVVFPRPVATSDTNGGTIFLYRLSELIAWEFEHVTNRVRKNNK